MNFKFIFLFFLFFSCGLKTKPIAPQKTALPSIPESYYTHPDDQEVEESDDKKK